MSIPVATSTVTVKRPVLSATDDPYVPDTTPAADIIVATRVRAVISSPAGTAQTVGGEQSVVEFRLNCDPVDLRQQDTVIDDQSGQVYEVQWSAQRRGFGLDHTVAGLRVVTGEAA